MHFQPNKNRERDVKGVSFSTWRTSHETGVRRPLFLLVRRQDSYVESETIPEVIRVYQIRPFCPLIEPWRRLWRQRFTNRW